VLPVGAGLDRPAQRPKARAAVAVVSGNLIGTDATGGAALGNGVDGVHFNDGVGVTLSGNTISVTREDILPIHNLQVISPRLRAGSP